MVPYLSYCFIFHNLKWTIYTELNPLCIKNVNMAKSFMSNLYYLLKFPCNSFSRLSFQFSVQTRKPTRTI